MAGMTFNTINTLAPGRARRGVRRNARRGSATLDYVLVMGIVLPMVAFVLWIAPRMMQSVYEMFCMFVASPWM